LTFGVLALRFELDGSGYNFWIIEASGQQLASEGTSRKEVPPLKRQSLARTQRQAICFAS
jgi:hypothetical protein